MCGPGPQAQTRRHERCSPLSPLPPPTGQPGRLAGRRLALKPRAPRLLSCELGLGDHGYGYLLASFGLGGALALGLVSGAGCIVVEVMVDTGLQRTLPEDVFARAYGIAYPAALAGIVAGSLIAARWSGSSASAARSWRWACSSSSTR
jgi:hypothetical protein